MKFVHPMEIYAGGQECPLCHAAPGRKCRQLTGKSRCTQETHPEREAAAVAEGRKEYSGGVTKREAADMAMEILRRPGIGKKRHQVLMDVIFSDADPVATYRSVMDALLAEEQRTGRTAA